MIKAIIISFIGSTYSFEITITNEFIYTEYTRFNEDNVKRFIIYELSTTKTHIIESDKKTRTVIDTKWHKDNWNLQSKKMISRRIADRLTLHGCDCIMLEEVWEMNFSKLDSVQGTYYSYQCNLSSLCEYLDLDPTSLNVLPHFKNLIETHPFEVARWTMNPTGKLHISPPLENIVYTELQDYDFIEELLMIELVKDK